MQRGSINRRRYGDQEPVYPVCLFRSYRFIDILQSLAIVLYAHEPNYINMGVNLCVLFIYIYLWRLVIMSHK